MPEGKIDGRLTYVLYVIQIVVFIAGFGIAYQRFDDAAKKVEVHTEQLNRVERYLSMKDPDYWRLSRQLGDNGNGR
jgi:hypothetical protein